MQGLELTLLLINAFLIIVIIAVYVHLSQIIEHDGVQIKVLTEKYNQAKEGMSAAQRMGLAAMYVGKKDNVLVRKEGQITDPHPYPIYTSSRGNFNVDHLIDKNATKKINVPSQNKTAEVAKTSASEVAESIGTSVATATQAGATQVAAIEGLKDDHIDNTDPTTYVETQQNGLVDTEKEGFVGVNARTAPAGDFAITSKGGSVFSKAIGK